MPGAPPVSSSIGGGSTRSRLAAAATPDVERDGHQDRRDPEPDRHEADLVGGRLRGLLPLARREDRCPGGCPSGCCRSPSGYRFVCPAAQVPSGSMSRTEATMAATAGTITARRERSSIGEHAHEDEGHRDARTRAGRSSRRSPSSGRRGATVPVVVTCCEGLSIFSENAISATKKSGTARIPATATGAFDAPRKPPHSRPAFEHAGEELARSLLARRREDLLRRPFLVDHARRRGSRPCSPPRARSSSRGWRGSSSSRSSASSRTSSSTSPISCGSSAEVISSSSISFGPVASARTIATRCCWPPERRSGNSSALSSRPIWRRSARAWPSACRARDPERLARRERHVLEHRHVREQVVRLEDDPDLLAQPVDVDLRPGDRLAVDDDRAGVDLLEEVDAAQQRRLPGARRADQADDLVLADVEIDPVQDLEIVEALASRPAARRSGAVRAHTACARSRRSRCLMMWSVKRASGIVRKMKKTAATTKAVVVGVVADVLSPACVTASIQPDDGDERRVLLEADEVVQERRDDAADRLRQHDVAHRLHVVQARASAPPSAGSDGPTRCRLGRPRSRRRCRRARAR